MALDRTPGLPYVRVAFGIILVYALLLAVLPPHPGRSIVGLFALGSVGYCTLALVMGRSLPLKRAEILAFAVGLTIVVLALSSLLVSVAGLPISDFVVVAVGLPVGLLAAVYSRPPDLSRTQRADSPRGLLDFSRYSRREKAVILALYGGIIAALLVLLSQAFLPFPDTLSPALAILGPDGTPDTLPTNFSLGRPENLTVVVLGDAQDRTLELRVFLAPQNATGAGDFTSVAWVSPLRLGPWTEARTTLSVGARASWSEQISIVVDDPGAYELRFELRDPTGTVLAANRLFILAA